MDFGPVAEGGEDGACGDVQGDSGDSAADGGGHAKQGCALQTDGPGRQFIRNISCSCNHMVYAFMVNFIAA